MKGPPLYKMTRDSEFIGYYQRKGQRFYTLDMEDVTDKLTPQQKIRTLLTYFYGKANLPKRYIDPVSRKAVPRNIEYVVREVKVSPDKKYVVINDEEVLKQIPECPDYYVNVHGAIYSPITRKFIQHQISSAHGGYHSVAIMNKDGYRQQYMVHRLVYYTWNQVEPTPGTQINHLEIDPNFNDLGRLEECTPVENTRYSMNAGSRYSYWDEERVHKVCQAIEKGATWKDIQRDFCPDLNDNSVKTFYHHLIHHTKFWKDISSQYDLKLNTLIKNLKSEEQVRGVCEDLLEGKLKQNEIAVKWNMDFREVSDIKHGRLYSNISSQYGIEPHPRHKYVYKKVKQ